MEHPDLVRLHAATPSPVAGAVSRIADPLVIVPGLVVAVSVTSASTAWAGLGWALVTIVFCVVVPELTLRAVVWVGRARDRQLVVREERRIPLLAALASVVAGVAVLSLLGGPRELVALVVAVLAGLTVMAALTRVWKVSFHANVAAFAVVVLAERFGPAAVVVGAPTVAVVAWVRVRGGRHSVVQVLAGAALGALVAALVFPALR